MGKKAMIFAAGLGTRLKPLTDRMPKALVPVNGKPIVRIVLEKLAAGGYDDIVVNVHHFADMLEEYLSTVHLPGVTVRISDERDLLRDTGGGIRHAAPLLKGSGRFLVHNVDILSNIDLGCLEAGMPGDAVAALAVSDRKSSRYLLFDDDMRLAGWTNAATGEIRSPYPSQALSHCRKYAFSGIHILSDEVFDIFDRTGFGERFSIIDFYLRIAAGYPVYGIVPDGLELLDVGKPEALSSAGDFLSGAAVRP